MKEGDKYLADLTPEEIKEQLFDLSEWLIIIISDLGQAQSKSQEIQMTERGRFINTYLSKSIEELHHLYNLLDNYPIQEERIFGEIIPSA